MAFSKMELSLAFERFVLEIYAKCVTYMTGWLAPALYSYRWSTADCYCEPGPRSGVSSYILSIYFYKVPKVYQPQSPVSAKGTSGPNMMGSTREAFAIGL